MLLLKKLLWIGLAILFVSSLGSAQTIPLPSTGATMGTASGPAFDVKAATDAYLAKVPADKKARSDAYFEGGYWLGLWDFVVAAAVLFLFLQTRVSSRLRDWAAGVSKWKSVQDLIYFVAFLLVTSLLQFPLTIYEGFLREHKYGLSTQNFGGWMRDQLVGLAVGAVLGGIAVVGLYRIVRRLGENWWVWGAVASIFFLAIVIVISPVYIAPLFNDFKKLENTKIKDSILSMARANGIPAKEVYEVDASRQSNRISAYVAGFMGTERIVLNDNLLNRCSPEEIQSVMGHEMGHYVLNHVYKSLLFTSVMAVVLFAFLNWAMQQALKRWGDRWGVHELTDIGGLPLAVLLLSIFFFVTTPLNNIWTRTAEYEADIFGLNAARQPDGEAEVDLKLGDYRKLDPGRLEEFLLFDHPSGRTRINAAMRWKAENMAVLPPGTTAGAQ